MQYILAAGKTGKPGKWGFTGVEPGPLTPLGGEADVRAAGCHSQDVAPEAWCRSVTRHLAPPQVHPADLPERDELPPRILNKLASIY